MATSASRRTPACMAPLTRWGGAPGWARTPARPPRSDGLEVCLTGALLGEALEPVVRDRLPRGCVGNVRPARRPDAGIVVERPEPHAHHLATLAVRAPQRAAAARAEALGIP